MLTIIPLLYWKLNQDLQSSNISAFEQFAKELSSTKINKIEYLAKEAALNYFKEELNKEEYNYLSTNNPFQNLFKVDFSKRLNTTEKEKTTQAFKDNFSYVSEISYSDANEQYKLGKNAIPKLMLPLLFISLAFCFSVIGGTINNDLLINEKSIKELVLSGANLSVIIAAFRSNMILNYFKAWFLALVLYILTFYLLNSLLQLNISELSFVSMIKPILVASLVILVGMLIMVHVKVSSNLKSI